MCVCVLACMWYVYLTVETMLGRIMMGYGLVGLGAMYLNSHWAVSPNLSIVRPLLDCSKVGYGITSLVPVLE